MHTIVLTLMLVSLCKGLMRLCVLASGKTKIPQAIAFWLVFDLAWFCWAGWLLGSQ